MSTYSVNESHPQVVVVRKVKTFAYGAHTVTREVDCDTCPACGSENHKVVAGRGYYERVDLCRCECGQKFEVPG